MAFTLDPQGGQEKNRGNALAAPDQCSVVISDPKPGAKVGDTGDVQGTADIPAKSHLRILAHRKGFAQWWPQGGGPADIQGREWTVTVHYGTEQDLGSIPLSRADVIDRLWQLAQLDPERTNCNITGQVKAAQALEQIFALNVDGNELLKRRLEGKSEADLEFYIVHGFLPYREEQKSIPAASAEASQLPESTAERKPPAAESQPEKEIPRTNVVGQFR